MSQVTQQKVIYILVQEKSKKIKAFQKQKLSNAQHTTAKIYQVGKLNFPAHHLVKGLKDPNAILYKVDLNNPLLPKVNLSSSSSIINVCEFIERNKCPECYFEIGKRLVLGIR